MECTKHHCKPEKKLTRALFGEKKRKLTSRCSGGGVGRLKNEKRKKEIQVDEWDYGNYINMETKRLAWDSSESKADDKTCLIGSE